MTPYTDDVIKTQLVIKRIISLRNNCEWDGRGHLLLDVAIANFETKGRHEKTARSVYSKGSRTSNAALREEILWLFFFWFVLKLCLYAINFFPMKGENYWLNLLFIIRVGDHSFGDQWVHRYADQIDAAAAAATKQLQQYKQRQQQQQLQISWLITKREDKSFEIPCYSRRVPQRDAIIIYEI